MFSDSVYGGKGAALRAARKFKKTAIARVSREILRASKKRKKAPRKKAAPRRRRPAKKKKR
jgi:hypothetical protein